MTRTFFLLLAITVSLIQAGQAAGGAFDRHQPAISLTAVAGADDVELVVGLCDFERLPKSFLRPEESIFASIQVSSIDGDVVRDFPLYQDRDIAVPLPLESDWVTRHGALVGFARRMRIPWKKSTGTTASLNLAEGRYRFRIGFCHRFFTDPRTSNFDHDRQIEANWNNPRSLSMVRWSPDVELELPSTHQFSTDRDDRSQELLIPEDRSLKVDMRFRTKVPGQMQVGEGSDVELWIEPPPESRIVIGQYSLTDRFDSRVSALLLRIDDGPAQDVFAEQFLSHGRSRDVPTELRPGIVAIFRRDVVPLSPALSQNQQLPKKCQLQAEIWAALFGSDHPGRRNNRIAVAHSQVLEFEVVPASSLPVIP